MIVLVVCFCSEPVSKTKQYVFWVFSPSLLHNIIDNPLVSPIMMHWLHYMLNSGYSCGNK